MAFSLSNTLSYEKSIEKEKSLESLKKAKAVENKRLKDGWKYIKINHSLQVLVPCDKNGNPKEDILKRLNSVL